MGRERYNGRRSTCSSKSKRQSNEANGCITALYHFFHIHHFYFPSRHHHHQQPSIDSHSRSPEGLVAPRNSLDLTEEPPLSTFYKLEKESLNIHVGGNKSTLRGLLIGTSSNNCNSPRTKAPNVVARLMGLDLLPDNLNLNKSSTYTVREHRLSGNGSGTRSLPSSPRISSDSDNRRLSLQLNRENKHEEFAPRTLKKLKQDEGSPSPKHKGRQIEERAISRSVGLDITNLLENKRAGAAQNQQEQRKVRSRFSQKENTTSTKPKNVFRQDQISQKPTTTLSKKINGCNKEERESKCSPYPTPDNLNTQRKAFIPTSTQDSSDCCDHLEKKKCKKISVASSSAFCVTERPRKQMKRAEEPEREAHATIFSGQMYKYEKKLPQEPFCDSTTISATLANARVTEKNLAGMTKLEEEEERIVAEIERHIVDALVQETVQTMSFVPIRSGPWKQRPAF